MNEVVYEEFKKKHGCSNLAYFYFIANSIDFIMSLNILKTHTRPSVCLSVCLFLTIEILKRIFLGRKINVPLLIEKITILIEDIGKKRKLKHFDVI